LLPLCGLARQKNNQNEGGEGRREVKGMIVKGMNMKAKPNANTRTLRPEK
jgi:hypothetical protein